MSNLISIQTQIEKLQKQAAQLKSKEFDATLQDIVARMQAFGIGIKDVQAALKRQGTARGKRAASADGPAGRAKRKPAATPRKAVAAKYRGPAGETWSGRGLMPRWLKTLVDQGHKKEDYAIAG